MTSVHNVIHGADAHLCGEKVKNGALEDRSFEWIFSGSRGFNREQEKTQLRRVGLIFHMA